MPLFKRLQMIRKNGVLLPKSNLDVQLLAEFTSQVTENQTVEVFLEAMPSLGSLAQQARLHAMIRGLAAFIGETEENLKALVKSEAGLCVMSTVPQDECLDCRSFARSSKEDLELSIETCRTIGERVGYAFPC